MRKQRNGKIAIVIGTKAELIKCMPIMLELQKRKRDYLIWLCMKLDELESKGILRIDDLQNNDEFYDIILQSLEIAMKNSRKEKLEFLQNMTINSIKKIDENKKEILKTIKKEEFIKSDVCNVYCFKP